MGLSLKYGCFLVCMILLLPALTVSETTLSRASYYRTADGKGTPTGACGYGDYGRKVYDGKVATASWSLYNDGVGCGACYHVKCKLPKLCDYKGVDVVVTDNGEGDRTDFILSTNGFAAMASPKYASGLFKYGVVDIEYERVPCSFSGNIKFKIHENSTFSDYLALIILDVDGQNDILAVEVCQDYRCRQSTSMTKAYGAVWDLSNPPNGPITMKFQASGSVGEKWFKATNVIPANWKLGIAYESVMQLY